MSIENRLYDDCPQLEDVFSLLHSHGLGCTVAGGCVRDLENGREIYNDIDIVVTGAGVMPLQDYTGLKSTLQGLGVVDLSSTGSMVSTDKILDVVSVVCNGKKVDIIFWNTSYITPLDCVFDFDYNINQYMLDVDGSVLFAGVNQGTLEKVGPAADMGDLRERGRLSHMENVARQLGWEYNDRYIRDTVRSRSNLLRGITSTFDGFSFFEIEDMI